MRNLVTLFFHKYKISNPGINCYKSNAKYLFNSDWAYEGWWSWGSCSNLSTQSNLDFFPISTLGGDVVVGVGARIIPHLNAANSSHNLPRIFLSLAAIRSAHAFMCAKLKPYAIPWILYWELRTSAIYKKMSILLKSSDYLSFLVFMLNAISHL